MFKVAIIGRPNTGKSTLFNKLVGKSFAITDDAPGVTRDRKEAFAKLADIEFVAVDTAGLESKVQEKSLQKRMIEQTNVAISDADLSLFVVDGKIGITNEDLLLTKNITNKHNIILVVNKCENLNQTEDDYSWSAEYFKLGFGEPVGISAEHKLGFGNLYEKIAPFFNKYKENFSSVLESKGEKPVLQIAIIGRPNSGKSTLLNKIIDEERVVTGPEAGITRDSVSVDYQFEGKNIRFIDTAGIRKKRNIIDKLEKLSTADSLRAVRFAQVVIMLFDANSMMDHQDMALVNETIREGRAIIFAVNKIDVVKIDKEEFMRQVRKQIQGLFPSVDGTCILGISAKTGYNVKKMLDYCMRSFEQWQKYIPTKKLNECLLEARNKHSPKLVKGKETKLKYITQIKKNPPTFAVFTNHIKSVEGDYQRFLTNFLREYFDLKLTPIRVLIRKSDNPYAKK
jgi:GTP-binding protein